MSNSYVLVFKDHVQVSFQVTEFEDFQTVFNKPSFTETVMDILSRGDSLYVVAIESYSKLNSQLQENEELVSWIIDKTGEVVIHCDNNATGVVPLNLFAKWLKKKHDKDLSVHYAL